MRVSRRDYEEAMRTCTATDSDRMILRAFHRFIQAIAAGRKVRAVEALEDLDHLGAEALLGIKAIKGIEIATNMITTRKATTRRNTER
jgi:hypothetical protein